MAKSAENALVAGSIDQMPAHIAKSAATGVGNENISASDLEIPQLKLLQKMSPEVDKSGGSYVDGAEPGMIFNTLTHRIADSMNVVNINMIKEVTVFRKREFGGGGSGSFIGTFDDKPTAEAYLLEAGLAVNEYDLADTAKHLVLVLDENGDVESEAMIYMSSTKMRTSNKWNSELLMTKADRYASVWQLGVENLSNAQGSWANFTIAFAGWCPEALLNRAKGAYEAVTG